MSVKVRERPKGSGMFWIFIDHQGKRKAKKIGKDKRLANEVAKKIEAKLTLGDLDLQINKEKAISFKDFSHLWLEDYIKPLRRQSTYERYRDMLNRHVYPFLARLAAHCHPRIGSSESKRHKPFKINLNRRC